MANQGPKILTFDIETAPLEARVWGMFQPHVDLSRLVKDWAVLSWSAKWAHKKRVEYRDTSKLPDLYDDRELMVEMREMLDEADIVVGQNVQKFDMRKVRARMIHHGLKPFREPVLQDTMLMARSVGAFTSNKLEYLSSKLTASQKSKHDEFPGFELWNAYLDRNPRAAKAMKAYNKQDVISTEELYFVLRPWVKRHPNVAQYFNDDKMRCPRCGSDHLDHAGVIHRGVSSYDTWVCGGCHGHSRSRLTVNSKSKRKSLLVTC